tara:strand:- start:31 stop:261 length:231 start_codon:yes stop_codon:yes gene_type:complete
MKKLILLFLIVPFVSFGQLNSNAIFLKTLNDDTYKAVYENMRQSAIEKAQTIFTFEGKLPTTSFSFPSYSMLQFLK